MIFMSSHIHGIQKGYQAIIRLVKLPVNELTTSTKATCLVQKHYQAVTGLIKVPLEVLKTSVKALSNVNVCALKRL